MEHFLGVAREKGLSDDEIGVVQSIVMGVSAGRIRAQFREVREKIEYDEGQRTLNINLAKQNGIKS